MAAAPTAMKPPARSAAASSPNNIEDYYVTPYELGYGPFVKFDHDFIGREALEKMAGKPHTQEGDVRLERRGHGEDLRLASSTRATRTTSSSTCRSPTMPRPTTTRVKLGGKTVGFSMFTGYSYNERSALSLGHDRSRHQDRNRGEGPVGRGERRHQEDHRRAPQADRSARHRQSGALLGKVARETYAEGWRTGKAEL